jgi:serine/threonine protein kinase
VNDFSVGITLMPSNNEIHSWEDELKFYVAIPLRGPSLDSLHSMCNKKFTSLTCLRLGVQMVNAVRSVHAAGVLHRDIKPANFLVDYQLPHKNIHLVDFGLSKRYKEGTICKTGAQRVGSLRYMSKYTHRGIESDWRDDLYSIAYVIIYLYVGSLPWKGLVADLTTDQKHTSILDIKTKYSNARLCSKLAPPKFSIGLTKFLDYLDTLRFGALPDYKLLISVLESCISDGEGPAVVDAAWDWSKHF